MRRTKLILVTPNRRKKLYYSPDGDLYIMSEKFDDCTSDRYFGDDRMLAEVVEEFYDFSGDTDPEFVKWILRSACGADEPLPNGLKESWRNRAAPGYEE